MNWIFILGFLLFTISGIISGISIYSKKLSKRIKTLLGDIAFVTCLVGFVFILISNL